MNVIAQIMATLRLAEALKRELRHSWLSDGRQESVAEHSYQMALMAVFIAPSLHTKVDLEHTLKIILIHDLVEALAGDIPFLEVSDRRAQKAAREEQAITEIRGMLPPDLGDDVYALWHEFEAAETREAKFARALDHLEVQFQHNLAPLDSWQPNEYELVYTKMDRHCEHDEFLQAFCEAVKLQAEAKLVAGGIDVEAVKAGIEQRSGRSGS